eukprot:TRINITY_DN744_c1_g1_i5.p3 TRINITY_DN744_c1_g1~~TRINITY_DN744_c1_g1_i5.p3  ORF type:complete len:220 (+),score=63.23 TRINITY_DN744_c1_g1_i5:1224-1883(+)
MHSPPSHHAPPAHVVIHTPPLSHHSPQPVHHADVVIHAPPMHGAPHGDVTFTMHASPIITPHGQGQVVHENITFSGPGMHGQAVSESAHYQSGYGNVSYSVTSSSSSSHSSSGAFVPAHTGGHLPMDHASFHDLKQRIQKSAFSSDKLGILEMALKGHLMTSHQAAEIVKDCFVHDSDQLTAAKAIYYRCVDPGSYYLVMDSLKHSSSKDELKKHTMGH